MALTCHVRLIHRNGRAGGRGGSAGGGFQRRNRPLRGHRVATVGVFEMQQSSCVCSACLLSFQHKSRPDVRKPEALRMQGAIPGAAAFDTADRCVGRSRVHR